MPPLQLIHLGVVPGRLASERRHVLSEQRLGPQGAQAHEFPTGQRARSGGEAERRAAHVARVCREGESRGLESPSVLTILLHLGSACGIVSSDLSHLWVTRVLFENPNCLESC